MNNNDMIDTILNHAHHSPRVKRIALILIFAGILFCITAMLPFVQNILFLIIDSNRDGSTESGSFANRLHSFLSLIFVGFIFLLFSLLCLFSKSIALFLKNEKNTKFLCLITMGICTLLLAFIAVFSYRYWPQWLNSDHSSEMVLGKLLAEEGTFASSSWHYSTEIRLIYQTIFTMPLFKILGNTNNWALIRSLNILLNNITLILSYLFLLRQMKIQTKWIYITGIFLITPVSVVYWDIVTFGGFYIFFIAQLFCCLGLFFRLAEHTDTKTTTLIYFILYSVLSFALGIQGIRSLFTFVFPLIITCVFLWLKTEPKKKLPLSLSCYAFILCFFGFAFNYLLRFRFSFHTFETNQLENLFENLSYKFTQSIASLAVFFGFSPYSQFLSAQGIYGIMVIIGTFLLFYAVFKFIRKIQTLESAEHRLIIVFFGISVIFNIFIFIIVSGKIIERYFIPFMIFYIPILSIFFMQFEKNYRHLKHIALVSGIILFIMGQCFLNFQSLSRLDVNYSRKGYIQYLADNKLQYGFATYWNANITTELSNGMIELAGLEPDSLGPGDIPFRIQGWLNPVKFYNPYWYEGESFLLLTRNEWELAQVSGRPFAFAQPDYFDDNYIVFRFPSAQIIHYEILDH